MATTAAEHKLLIDGEWIETGDWVDVLSPYSGELVGRVAKGGAAEARRAVDAAAKALENPLPAHKRAEILVRVAGLIGKRHEELARIISAEDGRFKLITFTGPGEVGWGIQERGRRKRVKLDLGNSRPVIVAADADVALTATKLPANAFAFAGQSCISVQRIYVERPAYDAFLETFVPKVEALKVGDPADDETDVGPVIDEGARERILAWIDEGARPGAELPVGGVDGSLIRPTALAPVR